MKKLSQKGFSAIEGLLILVIVGIIGGAGFYVYNSQKETNKSLDNANQTLTDLAKSKKSVVADETKDWLEYESMDKSFTVKIPDGWQLVQYHDDGTPYTMDIDNITYKKSTKATVRNTNFAGDINQVAFAMSYDESPFFGQPPKGDLRPSIQTDAGEKVEKYFYEYKEKIPDLPFEAGDKVYEYRIKRGKKIFNVMHEVLKGEQEQTKYVEMLIKTVNFDD